MTTGSDGPAFDPSLVATVARSRSMTADQLAALAADHQATMADNPGVENLVYEWRKQFDTTVLARQPDRFVVDAPEWVWTEFAESLEATPAERTALIALHERAAAESSIDDATLADATPIVLVR